MQPLFEPFLDTTDMIMCCPAGLPLEEINEEAKKRALRFPLQCDPSLSLEAHVAVVEYASHSARFGPFVDNILGMNWELTSKKIVRVGERVIKSTTGFDLQRFLLHSGDRYGKVREYVLRLRPLGGEVIATVFHGKNSVIERCRDIILKSPWIHWLDVVDIHLGSDGGASLEVVADCAEGEAALFGDYFQHVALVCGALTSPCLQSRVAGLPSLSLKATVRSSLGLAADLVRKHGGAAKVLCVNGVVHYYAPVGLVSIPEESRSELYGQCAAAGGHISGPLAGEITAGEQESVWAAMLQAAWGKL